MRLAINTTVDPTVADILKTEARRLGVGVGRVLDILVAKGEETMKQYVYVAAYFVTKEDAMEFLLSFKHVVVKAKSQEAAYDVGYKKAKIPKKSLANDYVFELPEALK